MVALPSLRNENDVRDDIENDKTILSNNDGIQEARKSRGYSTHKYGWNRSIGYA
eukprot:CAMPEP_0198111318 /NCGR_PEP_ID=MMETSP1442-20131203/3288_1 /TAXON_ID= /ORGANISM="Craspedostauros australis, Strain CCMP3328" /LENGTH=53 /DNA_ID=CAMNT_0043767699 /DNA_START=138 /DNA_END=297 /DNA_ORIENTATION=-